MAEGVREKTGADIGIGVTGIAGPGGGTPEKPVGLVYIAVAGKDGVDVKEYHFKGDRENNRNRSADTALKMLFDLFST